ncbi:Integral membrane protein [Colletotrichum tofieldiae]|nr:Integral membrane protein [Colletotrichum tofieldiae]GKT90108.1 integral membrane protein [Colletotrichum tofieldiae]
MTFPIFNSVEVKMAPPENYAVNFTHPFRDTEIINAFDELASSATAATTPPITVVIYCRDTLMCIAEPREIAPVTE